MLRSVVTVAKVTLVFLNIWVLAVVLVVCLGHWRVFDSNDPNSGYYNSHMIVMRELKEETEGKIGQKIANSTLTQSSHQRVNDGLHPHLSNVQGVQPKEPILEASNNNNINNNNIINNNNNNKDHDIKPPQTPDHPFSSIGLDARLSSHRYWCKQQHPHSTPYNKIPTKKLSSILVDEHHKFLFCQIPGVAINEWRKILLILNKIVNVTSVDLISGGDVFGKYSKLPKRLDQFNEKRRTEMLNTYYKVMFVREPLERLVIAYRTKLQGRGSKYFHKAYGSQIIKMYRKGATAAEIKDGTSVRFPEFVKFIINVEHLGVEALNEHWGQYYKQCHPCLVNYDFVGTFENIEKDTTHVIEKLKAERLVKPPYVTDNRSLPQKELMKIYGEISAQELNNLFKIYSADYTLFGYQCPSFVHELMKKGNIVHDY